MEKYYSKDIEAFNNDFLKEYAELKELLFSSNEEYREIEASRLEAKVDSCKQKLQNMKKLKPIKFKGFSGF